MINIYIAETFAEQVQPDLLERAAQAVLQHQEAEPNLDLSIDIDDDARLQELNNEFLSIDAPTDVLSFPSGGDEVDPETGNAYLGDIVISYPRAQEQANAAGHPVENEMQLLVVHGMLHLLGFDHASDEEKEEMWAVQGQILKALGVHLNRLPE